MEKFCDSLENFLFSPCYRFAVHIHLLCTHKGIHSHALLPLLEQQTCHLKVLGLNPSKVSPHGNLAQLFDFQVFILEHSILAYQIQTENVLTYVDRCENTESQ